MHHLPWLILITLYGACVGSFLNVVAYRLPEGKSVIRPPSQCPKCGHLLAWYDNIPVLGWLLLRGRCRYCQAPISVQYPIMEAITALLFGGLYAIFYLTDLRPGFSQAGFGATWPAFLIHLVLVAALVAATLIDARLFIIPLSIPWIATAVAMVGLPLAVALGWLTPLEDVVPLVRGPEQFGGAMGGLLGLIAALGLLQSGMLPRSFDEVEEELEQPAPPEEFLNHPHPRREVLKECLFVVIPLLGAAVGWLIVSRTAWPTAPLPATAQAIGGTVAGYLVGGGLIWGTRIAGTLIFGKEAMGLGDVHLLAAIGAVIGPMDTVLVFFAAPFLGLAAALILAGVQALLKGQVRVIPYGPYLAGAAVLIMALREPIRAFLGIF